MGLEDCVLDIDAFKEYLGRTWTMLVYLNQQSLDVNEYGQDRIRKYSTLSKVRTVYTNSILTGQYTSFDITLQEMTDEASYIQLGQSDTINFYSVSQGNTFPAVHNTFPSYQGSNRLKLNSVQLTLDQKKIVIERTIYSVLDWIGDIGGLYDGLRLMADFFMINYAVAMMKQELLRLFMITQPDA